MFTLPRDRRSAGAAQATTMINRGPGWPVPAVPKAAPVPPVTPEAAVLVVVRNMMAEPVSVRAQAWTPAAAAFLDTHVADIEVGGATAFVASVANDLRVDLPYTAGGCAAAPRRLALVGNELRLQPGTGLEQKQQPLSQGLPFGHCLSVILLGVDAESPAAPLPQSFDELVANHPGCQSVRAAVAAAGSTLPPQRTLLVPRTLPSSLMALEPEELLARLATGTAVFCGPLGRGGADLTLDGSLLTAEPEAATGQVKFAVGARGELPSLEMRCAAAPLRCADRFQLVFLEI